MKEYYEKQIGLNAIYLTLVRRFHLIILIFVPITLVTFLVTNFMMTKTYQSSVTLNRGAVISAAQHQIIQSYISNTSASETAPGAVYTTAVNLKEAGVKHPNGNEITVNEIKSGLSFSSYVSSEISLKFNFTSSDKTIIKKVCDELAAVSIANLQAYHADYKNLQASETTNPVKNSSENKYFLIGVAASAILALSIPFVYEIVSDQVYDKKDITAFGGDAFTLTVTDKK